MRYVVLALVALLTVIGCSTTQSATPLTDAERCARFGGLWSFDSCRSGN